MRSKKIEEYKAHLRLSADQREILVGILLGDASLETQNEGRTYRVKIEHSLSQRCYIEHLYAIFKDWVLTQPHLRKITLANGKTYSSIVFPTLSHPSFRFYAHQFYQGNAKKVPKLIDRWLTPKALAYWFMDDGSIKSKQSKGIIFNTQGFQKPDVARLVNAIGNVFKLEARLRKQKEGYQIYISGKSYEKFRQLVLPYILPEMVYKLPEVRRTYLPKL